MILSPVLGRNSEDGRFLFVLDDMPKERYPMEKQVFSSTSRRRKPSDHDRPAAAMPLRIPARDANADTGAAAGGTAKVAVVQLVDNDAFTEMIDSFENKLTELYGDGVTYDVKNAQGDMSTLNSIASELKTADYDLVVPIVTPATQAVVNAGVTAPVVFISVTDPVAAGIMGDMAKPDKNATGTSNIVPVDEIFTLAGKLTLDVKNIGILYCSGEKNAVLTRPRRQRHTSIPRITPMRKSPLPPRTRCSRRRSRSQARLTRSTSRSTPPCSPRWRRSSRRRTQQVSRFTALTGHGQVRRAGLRIGLQHAARRALRRDGI